MRNRYKPQPSPIWDTTLTVMFFLGMAAFWLLFGWTLLGGTLANLTEALK